MALRVRADGSVVCAAQSYEWPGDVYIDDHIQYCLALHFRKPETEEDRQWAELYQRCAENNEDPRKYWPPAIAELKAIKANQPFVSRSQAKRLANQLRRK